MERHFLRKKSPSLSSAMSLSLCYPMTLTLTLSILLLSLATLSLSCPPQWIHQGRGGGFFGENITEMKILQTKFGRNLPYDHACVRDEVCKKPHLVCDHRIGRCACRNPEINYEDVEMYPQLCQTYNSQREVCQSYVGKLCTTSKMFGLKEELTFIECVPNARCVHEGISSLKLNHWSSGDKEIFGLCRCMEGFVKTRKGLCVEKKVDEMQETTTGFPGSSQEEKEGNTSISTSTSTVDGPEDVLKEDHEDEKMKDKPFQFPPNYLNAGIDGSKFRQRIMDLPDPDPVGAISSGASSRPRGHSHGHDYLFLGAVVISFVFSFYFSFIYSLNQIWC